MKDAGDSSKWVRIAAILLIACGILQIPIRSAAQSVGHELVEIAVGVLAVAVIPIVSKAWPIAGEQLVSLKKWSFILIMMFVGGVVIKFQDVWFASNPLIGRWLVVVLFAGTGMTLVLARSLRS
jgi:hypothetical protein